MIVGAQSKEFDYPSASGTGGDAYNNWTGTTGIKLDTPLSRILFAARFGDLNLLISNQITGSSQLLFNRSIEERVQAIAPFLRYDKDPYLVVTASGRLDYVLDAFTTSAAFPDANSYDPGSDSSRERPRRRSVQLHPQQRQGRHGRLRRHDDVLRRRSRPTRSSRPGRASSRASSRPIGEHVANDLQAHLRYPEDMFNAQTTQFEKYHVTDPGVFYQGNDVWQVPQTSDSSGTGPQQLALEAYYVQMRVPGKSRTPSSCCSSRWFRRAART